MQKQICWENKLAVDFDIKALAIGCPEDGYFEADLKSCRCSQDESFAKWQQMTDLVS